MISAIEAIALVNKARSRTEIELIDMQVSSITDKIQKAAAGGFTKTKYTFNFSDDAVPFSLANKVTDKLIALFIAQGFVISKINYGMSIVIKW